LKYRFLSTLDKWMDGITNYFINRQTIGFVEGFNNKIKVITRRCYGILNVKHLFQRIFFICLIYQGNMFNANYQRAKNPLIFLGITRYSSSHRWIQRLNYQFATMRLYPSYPSLHRLFRFSCNTCDHRHTHTTHIQGHHDNVDRSAKTI